MVAVLATSPPAMQAYAEGTDKTAERRAEGTAGGKEAVRALIRVAKPGNAEAQYRMAHLYPGTDPAAPAWGPFSGVPSSVQSEVSVSPGVLKALALSEAPISESCQRQLPTEDPLPKGSCALRTICLPRQSKPVEIRVCNHGSHAEGAPERKSLPAPEPRPAIWRWTQETQETQEE